MIVTCPECMAKISERADPCPKCGLPNAGDLSKEHNEAIAQALREEDVIYAVIGCPSCSFREELRVEQKDPNKPQDKEGVEDLINKLKFS